MTFRCCLLRVSVMKALHVDDICLAKQATLRARRPVKDGLLTLSLYQTHSWDHAWDAARGDSHRAHRLHAKWLQVIGRSASSLSQPLCELTRLKQYGCVMQCIHLLLKHNCTASGIYAVSALPPPGEELDYGIGMTCERGHPRSR